MSQNKKGGKEKTTIAALVNLITALINLIVAIYKAFVK